MNQWNIQVAVRTRLLATSSLFLIVSDRVYDDVPQDTVFPYVVIGDDTSIPWDQDCKTGADTTLTIHAWSRYSGRKEVKDMLQAIYNGLHNFELNVTGGHNVLCQAEYEETFLDPDGATRHGVIRFRLLTTHPKSGYFSP